MVGYVDKVKLSSICDVSYRIKEIILFAKNIDPLQPFTKLFSFL